jgi:dihydroorotate dehydrogenase
LALTPQLDPVTPPAFKHVQRDFYECKGLLGDWYEKIIVAEINFLAKQHGLTIIANHESGISTRSDVQGAQAAGASVILVGEALVKSGDPISAMQELLGRR